MLLLPLSLDICKIYFVLAYQFFLIVLCVRVVSEKVKRQKEGMEIMGLQNEAYWLSWFILYLLPFLLSSLSLPLSSLSLALSLALSLSLLSLSSLSLFSLS